MAVDVGRRAPDYDGFCRGVSGFSRDAPRAGKNARDTNAIGKAAIDRTSQADAQGQASTFPNPPQTPA
ncbi:hypothetical protein U0E23_18570 [Burkholderia stagnalis]|uniref:hypothetical protein n=1 Tax=Burkholderia stagnalis TaxID=1503054 RepID=UPI002AB35597|nr:hypothetical protein [Burkholderia stagnalis]MDY7804449.1 hypothetical protein [Burkholderia stagnalis]